MLQKAESGRMKCTECRKMILKGELHFRRIQRGWRNSHTVNLCRKCVIKMFLECNIENKELIEIKKEMMQKVLTGK